MNDTLTLADFTVVAPLFHAEPAKIPLEKYGNIKRWFGPGRAAGVAGDGAEAIGAFAWLSAG